VRGVAAGACVVALLATAACGQAAGRQAAVPGAWTWVATDHTLACPSCTYRPIAADLSVAGGTGVPFPAGTSIDVRVSIADVGSGPIVLRGAVSLPVEVVPTAGGSALWTGVLPALPSRWSGNGDLSFVWNERNSAGRLVPAGAYLLELKLPLTIDYTMGGAAGRETLQGVGDPASGETFAVPLRIA